MRITGRIGWWGAAAVIVALTPPSSVAAQAPWVLTGVVADSVTGLPIDGAHVEWVEEERDYTTSDGGRFEILDVHRTTITLRVAAPGHRAIELVVSSATADGQVTILLPAQAVQLSGIEVQVARTTQGLDLRAPQATTRLGSAQITRERGQTLGETLRGVEGVSVIQYGPSVAKPVVRGLHSQRIVVMNDGVRQEGQQWGGEHAPEIDVFSVNEIEVVRGPSSVLYGSDALGGVLRIEPAAQPSQTGLGGELGLNTFSNNRQFSGSVMVEHGRIEIPALGMVGARFRLSGRKSGDAATADYNLTNTGFTELNFGATAGAVRPWGEIELDYTRFESEIGLFTGAHVGNFDDLLRAMSRGPVPTEFGYEINDPKQKVTHNAVRVHGHSHMHGIGHVEGTYGFQLNRRREFDSHGPLANRATPAFGLDLYTHTFETRLNHDQPGWLSGAFGFSGMRQGNISTGKAFLIPQYRLYTGAVFLSEEADAGWAVFSGGVRYEYRWQRVFEFADAGIDVPDETKKYDGVAASFGVTVPFGDTWALGATVGRAWRAPNVNERYSQGIHHGTAQYELGDPALDKEHTLNVDATLKRVGERVSLQLSGYRNAIRDYIYLEPRAPVLSIRGAYPAFKFQQTDAVIVGAEAGISAKVLGSVELRASGSLLRGTDDATDDPLYDMPSDRFQLGVRFDLPSTSWAAGPFFDVGVTAVRDQNRVPAETVYALPTDGYQLVNLELGANWVSIGGQRVEIGLEARNLLDTAYRDYLSRYKLFVDDPGRDLVVRVRMPLGETY